MPDETLLSRDIGRLIRTLRTIEPKMAERMEAKWSQRGSFLNQEPGVIAENLGRNGIQFVRAFFEKDIEELRNQGADIFNLTLMLIYIAEEVLW